MGFWKDMMNARPSKSFARANELHECKVQSSQPIPSFMYDKVFDCEICKVRFGQIFAKDSRPMLVNTEITPSFARSENGVVVCHKCVITFGFFGENL